MLKPQTIEEIKGAQMTWVNVQNDTPEEMEYLQETFRFHALDLKDCLPPLQRPKLMVRQDYIFMILLFPVFDRLTRKIRAAEVDFFINSSTVVTVHDKTLLPMTEFFESVKAGKHPDLLNNSPANFLYELLDLLTMYCFPMLVHFSNDIDQIEEHILETDYKAAEYRAREIFRVKTNIVNFRKAIRPMKYVVESLVKAAPQFFSVSRLNIFFEEVVSRTREIWDLLENYKESIDALHETNESILASSTNAIMKTLTTLALTFIPATIIASLFSTSFKNFPWANWPGGFWMMLILMMGGVLGLYLFLKNKKGI